MKKLFFILLIQVFPLLTLAQVWTKNNAIPGAQLSDAIKINNKVIVISQDGLYKSLDNGEHWEKMNTNIPIKYYNNNYFEKPKIFYTSTHFIYIKIGDYVYYSKNEGEFWYKYNLENAFPDFISHEFAIKDSTFIISVWGQNILYNASFIYKSIDFGDNWIALDTFENRVSLENSNNEIYAFFDSTNQRTLNYKPLLYKLDNNYTLQKLSTKGIDSNSSIYSICNFNSSFIISAETINSGYSYSDFYYYINSTWIKVKSINEYQKKLFIEPKRAFFYNYSLDSLFISNTGIVWSGIKTNTNQHCAIQNTLSIDNHKSLAFTDYGAYNIDSSLLFTEKFEGLTSPFITKISKFKSKVFALKAPAHLYFSENDGVSFSKVNQYFNIPYNSLPYIGFEFFNTEDALFVMVSFNDHDVIYMSYDGSQWDTIQMPDVYENFRSVLGYNKDGIFIKYHNSTVSKLMFFNTKLNTWTDLNSFMPNGLANHYYKATHGPGNDLIVYYELNNSNNDYKFFRCSNNGLNWFQISSNLSSKYSKPLQFASSGNKFYVLNASFVNKDSLFILKNDSLLFDKVLDYGNLRLGIYQYGKSIYNFDNNFYVIGIDSSTNTPTTLRSYDLGKTWQNYNNGTSLMLNNSILFGQKILAGFEDGLYEIDRYSNLNLNVRNGVGNLFPNPCNHSFNLILEKIEKSKIEVISLDGEIVYSGTSSDSTITINTSELNEGIYLVRVISDSIVRNHKILVMH